MIVSMTEEEYLDYSNAYCGICTECGEINDGVEPDAEGYLCSNCDEEAVTGIENALICDLIEIIES